VNGLHRGDHAELAEARDVGGIDGLDVLDAVAAASFGRGVGRGGSLIRVERHAHGAVADRMCHYLPAALVEHRDDVVQLFGREARVACDRRAIGVGLEHRSGV
jgi:hypothetical protein